MFKSRRKSFKTHHSPYYSRRKRRFPSPWLILAAIPLFLIAVELLARSAIAVSGKSKELARYKGEPALVTAYRLQFLSKDLKPYTALPDGGELQAKHSMALGYQLVGKQKNKYWTIDEQGFRDEEPLPLEKPKDEIRIFILGNSAAFGKGNESNAATIAPKLETLMNDRVATQKKSPDSYRPDALSFYKPERDKALALPPKVRPGTYRIINAAVPGYTSGNHLAQLALQILPYKPDVIIVLGGYTDLMLPSDKTATNIPQLDRFLTNASGHYRAALSQSLGEWLANSATYKALQYWVLNPEPSLAEKTLGMMEENKSLNRHLAGDEVELQRRVDRYYQNYKQMVQLCAGSGIPVVLALQPEVTGNSPENLKEEEKEMLEALGDRYQKGIEQGYTQLATAQDRLKKAYPNNVYIFNFHKIGVPKSGSSASEAIFSDPIHLSEDANTELSKRLYDAVTGIPKIQLTPKNFELK